MAIANTLVFGSMDIDKTAALHKIKPQTVRSLLREPSFQAELAKLRAAKLEALKAPAIEEITKQLKFDSENIIAGANIRFRAADRILGGEGQKQSGVQVNVGLGVQVNSATTISPGYVMKPFDPAQDARLMTRTREGATLTGEAEGAHISRPGPIIEGKTKAEELK